MSSPLAQFITSKMKKEKLSLEAVAKAIDVSAVSLRGVLKGKSRPNKSTAAKYSKYSGVSIEEILQTKAKSATPSKKRSTSKAGSKATGRGKRAGKGKSRGGRSGQNTVVASLLSATQAAAKVLGDDLAIRVHHAPASAREMIDRLLG